MSTSLTTAPPGIQVKLDEQERIVNEKEVPPMAAEATKDIRNNQPDDCCMLLFRHMHLYASCMPLSSSGHTNQLWRQYTHCLDQRKRANDCNKTLWSVGLYPVFWAAGVQARQRSNVASLRQEKVTDNSQKRINYNIHCFPKWREFQTDPQVKTTNLAALEISSRSGPLVRRCIGLHC